MTPLAARLARALTDGAGRPVDLLDGDDRAGVPAPDGERTLPAAVLVPVTDRARPGVILTQRPDTMRRHPGQVAFPGGRIDPGETVVAAALREAQEEIALDPAHVAIIGETDPYRTGTGFRVTPVVGVIPADLPLIPSEAEVAAVFEVPLDFLLDTANHARRRAMWLGRERQYYEILWDDRRIWGATAAMIVNLARRLAWTA